METRDYRQHRNHANTEMQRATNRHGVCAVRTPRNRYDPATRKNQTLFAVVATLIRLQALPSLFDARPSAWLFLAGQRLVEWRFLMHAWFQAAFARSPEFALADWLLSADERRTLSATPWLAAADSVPLGGVNVTATTGEKPQSKVWEYDGQWFTVLPDASGTWVRRLDGNTWTSVLRLTPDTHVQADVKTDGNLAHVLLFDGVHSQLATIEYVPGGIRRGNRGRCNPSSWMLF